MTQGMNGLPAVPVGVELDPDQAADPQMVVAAAINDVIVLARMMSAKGLGRGEVEMRRRLALMDAALAQAERAGVLATGDVAGSA